MSRSFDSKPQHQTTYHDTSCAQQPTATYLSGIQGSLILILRGQRIGNAIRVGVPC